MRRKLIITLVALSLVCFLVSKMANPDYEGYTGVPNLGKVTLAQYDEIKTGMSYSKVCEIFGDDGIMAGEIDLGFGLEYETIYMWEGASVIGANVKITFRNGKVTEKEQIGLM